jgi:Anti-sigma-K factor rskA
MADDQLNEFNELDVRIDATLASGSTWTQPPANLRAQVLAAALAAETGDNSGAVPRLAPVSRVEPTTGSAESTTRSAESNVVDLTARRQRRGPHWLAAAVAGAAAAIIGTLIVTQLRTTEAKIDATAAMAPTEAYPGVDGTANMRETSSGWEFRLTTKNLTRLEKPFFYEAWIEGDKGLIPIGTFHTGVDVVLWGGVELDEYPKIVVTKEQEDGNPAASNDRVLEGAVVFRQR